MKFDYDHDVGKQIKRIRELKGWTQEVLSAKIQVAGCDYMTRSALAKIESGQRHVYANDIRIVKDVLDVSFDELLPPMRAEM